MHARQRASSCSSEFKAQEVAIAVYVIFYLHDYSYVHACRFELASPIVSHCMANEAT